MPLYEYECNVCKNEFEKLSKKIVKSPRCPKCGKKDSKKMVSKCSFVLKGGGWANQGYSSQNS